MRGTDTASRRTLCVDAIKMPAPGLLGGICTLHPLYPPHLQDSSRGLVSCSRPLSTLHHHLHRATMSSSTAVHSSFLTAFAPGPRHASGAHAHAHAYQLAPPVATMEHGKRGAISRSNSPDSRSHLRAQNAIRYAPSRTCPHAAAHRAIITQVKCGLVRPCVLLNAQPETETPRLAALAACLRIERSSPRWHRDRPYVFRRQVDRLEPHPTALRRTPPSIIRHL